MIVRRLTDNEIRIRIVPMHLRWPEAGTSVVWRRLHECVQQLHEYVRTVDDKCKAIEQIRDLGRDGIERQRTELAREAMKKLTSFRPFDIAEHAVTMEIDALEKRQDLRPQEAQAKHRLMKALDELRAGIAATKRLLIERCKISDGSARPQYY